MKKNKIVLILAIVAAGTVSQATQYVISQKDKKFDKAEIVVEPGDTVQFYNQEKDITHNVYSLGPKNSFELKTQAPGTKSDVVFKEEGETEVECAIHPGMKFKVKVKAKKK